MRQRRVYVETEESTASQMRRLPRNDAEEGAYSCRAHAGW